MSQENIQQIKERVNKLMAMTEEIKKAVSELHEKLKTSELVGAVERLGELKDTLRAFMLRDYAEFSITLRDTCATANCEDVEVLVERKNFRRSIEVKRNTSIVDIYKMFFDDASILEHLVDNIVATIANIASEVKKNTDLLEKIQTLEQNISWIDTELGEIRRRLEDP